MSEDTDSVSMGGAIKTLKANTEILPLLESYELRKVWKSWRPTTSDYLPVIGSYGEPNIILALGFSGLGYNLALVAADFVVRLLLGDKPESIPKELSPFRPGLELSSGLLHLTQA